MNPAGWITFEVPGNPVGKPRMTQRDKWQQRPPVVAYRRWADLARVFYTAARRTLKRVDPGRPPSGRIEAVAFFATPRAWSIQKRDQFAGSPHRVKPDVDNVGKALLDALFENDQVVHHLNIRKVWDDGSGPRLRVTMEF